LLLYIIGFLLHSIAVVTVVYVALFACYYYYRLPPPPKSNHLLRVFANGGIIAHRAGAHDAPENTIPAIRLAATQGAAGVEVDVGFTIEGIPILIHDPSVNRTTNGTGNIQQMTLKQIQSLDATCKHQQHQRFKGTTIPTLEQAIVECKKLNLFLFLDIKAEAARSAVLLSLLYKYDFYDQCLFCSFYPHILYRLRRLNSAICVAFTYRKDILYRRLDGTLRNKEWYRSIIAYYLDQVLSWAFHCCIQRFLGCSLLLIYKKELSERLIEECQQKEIQIAVWTVNRIIDKQWMKAKHIAYMTDITKEDEECEEQTS